MVTMLLWRTGSAHAPRVCGAIALEPREPPVLKEPAKDVRALFARTQCELREEQSAHAGTQSELAGSEQALQGTRSQLGAAREEGREQAH